MGSSHNRIRAYDLAARCCHGAFYAVGFLTTTLIFMAVLWVVWCYFGLSILQVSNSQRRALVNYSSTTAKPPIFTTSPPLNQSSDGFESSLNTISKSVTTSSSFHRGASRGEWQLKHDPDTKDISRGNSSLAKGDFASRDRAPPAAKDLPIVSTAPPLQNSKSDNGNPKDAIPSVEIKDDGIQTRRVVSSNTNRHDPREPIQNKDVMEKDNPSVIPLKVLDPVLRADITPTRDVFRDEINTSSREYPKPERSLTAVRDEIQSSRRSDADTMSRLPNIDPEPQSPPRPYVRERTKYDEDEDRGLRSRLSERDRVRDRVPYTDDIYSKGDTRLYPEDGRGRLSEERYTDERIPSYGDDRYRDLPRRRGDGDRIRDSDERYIYRDETPHYMDDDSRYKSRDTRHEGNDGDRYRVRDEDRYRLRDDRRYRLRNEKNDRSKDDDKYKTSYEDQDDSRIDDRYRTRVDDRDRPRIEDRDRPRIDDRDKPRIDGRPRIPIYERDRPIINDRDISRRDDRDRSIISESDRSRSYDKDRSMSYDKGISRTDDRGRSSIDDRGKIDDRDRSKIDDRVEGSRIIEPDRSRIEDKIKGNDKDVSLIDDRYKTRVESIDRPRFDDRYEYEGKEKVGVEDRYRSRDEDRDKYREYRRRGDDRDLLSDEDDYRSRDGSRRRISEDKFTEEHPQDTRYSGRDRYIPRIEDRYKDDTRTISRDYRDPISDKTDALPPLGRNPLPVRKSSNVRGDSVETEYDHLTREPVRTNSDEISRTISSDTRRRVIDDEYRRPSRYDDRDRISPSRVRDDTYSTSLDSSRSKLPPSILTGSRRKDHYLEDSTRMRDTEYYDDEERKRIYSSSEGSSRRSQDDDRREYKTRLPGDRGDPKYVERGEEVILDRRSYASEEDDDYRDKSNSRVRSYDGKTDTRLRGDDEEYEHRSKTDDESEYSRRRKYDVDDDSEYPRRRKDGEEEFRHDRSREDYEASRTRHRDGYEYSRDDDRYDDDRTVRRYDDVPRKRDEVGLRKDVRPHRNIDDRSSPTLDRIYPQPKLDEALTDVSRPISTIRRDPIAESSSNLRVPIGNRDMMIQGNRERSSSDDARVPHRTVSSDSSDSRIAPDSGRRGSQSERPLNAKDVIDAALRHSDLTDSVRKVSYPVFDPRVSNLTSPDVIRPSERRGSTVLSRRRRRLGV